MPQGCSLSEDGASTLSLGEKTQRGVCMGCETNCLNEHRLETIEQELKEIRDKHSRDSKVFYDRIGALERDNVLFGSDIQHIKGTMDEMNENIKTLMATPAKRYETIIACVITTVVGALIGFLISGVLPM